MLANPLSSTQVLLAKAIAALVALLIVCAFCYGKGHAAATTACLAKEAKAAEARAAALALSQAEAARLAKADNDAALAYAQQAAASEAKAATLSKALAAALKAQPPRPKACDDSERVNAALNDLIAASRRSK